MGGWAVLVLSGWQGFGGAGLEHYSALVGMVGRRHGQRCA